jgi:hypothetical protein
MAADHPTTPPRRSRQHTRWLDLLIAVIILAALALLGVLIMRQTDEDDPGSDRMTGPGIYEDATGDYTFRIDDGWEVLYEDDLTRVSSTSNANLPDYTLELREDYEMNLVINWNCYRLRERLPFVAQATAPGDATLVYANVPCADDITLPTYGRIYLQMNDTGQNVVIVFGPAGGKTWLVARAGPFEGEPSPSLIEAMTSTTISAREK